MVVSGVCGKMSRSRGRYILFGFELDCCSDASSSEYEYAWTHSPLKRAVTRTFSLAFIVFANEVQRNRKDDPSNPSAGEWRFVVP
eukprot:scaffold9334_cov44-Prasinocladus_malaysianus.AAC.1